MMTVHRFESMDEFRAAFGRAMASLPQESLSRVQRSAMLTAFQAISVRSPVVSGMFRGNNIVSSNTLLSQPVANPDTSGTVSMAAAKAQIDKLPVFGVAYISNPLPYAPTIEFGLFPRPRGAATGLVTADGFSKQAPRGVYRVSLQDTISALPSIVSYEKARLSFSRNGDPIK